MAKDTGEIVVGANGTIYSAPAAGATLPVDILAAIDAAFVDLGYASEDGVTLRDGKTVNDINGWQSFYALRKVVTARQFELEFELSQFDKDQVSLAFGGGTVAAEANGTSFTPPSPETIDERAMVVDWVDGTKNFRLVVPKMIVTNNVETQLQRSANAALSITMGVIGEDGVDPWVLYTDAPNFVP